MSEFMGRVSETISFGGNGGFFGHHNGDLIAHGIDALASAAFQAGIVRQRLQGSNADGASKYGEKLLWNLH